MVFEKVRDIIVEATGCEEDEITLETTADDVGADSLDKVTFLIELEDEFDIEIPDDVAREFSTVGEVVEFVREVM